MLYWQHRKITTYATQKKLIPQKGRSLWRGTTSATTSLSFLGFLCCKITTVPQHLCCKNDPVCYPKKIASFRYLVTMSRYLRKYFLALLTTSYINHVCYPKKDDTQGRLIHVDILVINVYIYLCSITENCDIFLETKPAGSLCYSKYLSSIYWQHCHVFFLTPYQAFASSFTWLFSFLSCCNYPSTIGKL